MFHNDAASAARRPDSWWKGWEVEAVDRNTANITAHGTSQPPGLEWSAHSRPTAGRSHAGRWASLNSDDWNFDAAPGRWNTATFMQSDLESLPSSPVAIRQDVSAREMELLHCLMHSAGDQHETQQSEEVDLAYSLEKLMKLPMDESKLGVGDALDEACAAADHANKNEFETVLRSMEATSAGETDAEFSSNTLLSNDSSGIFSSNTLNSNDSSGIDSASFLPPQLRKKQAECAFLWSLRQNSDGLNVGSPKPPPGLQPKVPPGLAPTQQQLGQLQEADMLFQPYQEVFQSQQLAEQQQWLQANPLVTQEDSQAIPLYLERQLQEHTHSLISLRQMVAGIPAGAQVQEQPPQSELQPQTHGRTQNKKQQKQQPQKQQHKQKEFEHQLQQLGQSVQLGPATESLGQPAAATPAPGKQREKRFSCHFLVHMEDAGFGVVSKLIGHHGKNMRKIAQVADAKVRVRGRGSGHIEANGVEADVPMMIALTTARSNEGGFRKAFAMTLDLLRDAAPRYADYCQKQGVAHLGPYFSIGRMPADHISIFADLLESVKLA